MQSSARISAQQILMYIVIGVVLIAAVIAVIFWAKSRSENYATSDQAEQGTQETAGTEETFSEDESINEEDEAEEPDVTVVEDEEEGTSEELVVTGSTESTPPAVPSTGPGDALLPVAALSALAFAGLKYTQSRRRLMALR